MLEIMRELELTGEEAIVTDHGRPVLRIVPIHKARSVSEVFQLYRQKQKLKFLEPPDTSTVEEWGEA
jgi:antitoxin (DNA-binding transcriptional repressor) of toxin-antitoxin stability system